MDGAWDLSKAGLDGVARHDVMALPAMWWLRGEAACLHALGPYL